MTMGYGSYEELLAVFAEWLGWIREKKAVLQAQKARLDAGKRKQDNATAPSILPGGEDYAHLAGLDGAAAASAQTAHEQQALGEIAGERNEQAAESEVVPVPAAQQNDQDELA